MITIELNTKELKQFEIILFAWSFSSAPRLIEANGAPPRPNKLVKAVIIVIIALHKPIPAIAKAPSSILPIYIRLYSKVTICAKIDGIASDNSNFEIFSLASRSFIVIPS